MHKSNGQQSQILKKISLDFSRHRRRRRGRSWYPASLKDLALRAVNVGITPGQVARAAGVSPQSMSNWRGAGVEAAEAPRELKVIAAETEEPLLSSRASGAMLGNVANWARIELRTGIRIEIPVSALSGPMLAALMGGGK